jgi:fermentation-respiration switch protein FrsA (DUF1100 family)
MCIVSYLVMKQIFGRHSHKEGEHMSDSFMELMGPDFKGYLKDRNEHIKIAQRIDFQKVTVRSDDGFVLYGYSYRNPALSSRTAILIHGHHSNAFEGSSSMALSYIRHGYSVLMPDSRACGNSEGKLGTFGVQERYDVLKWAKYITQHYPAEAIVLQGCSLGAATVCMCADLNLPNNVKAIVSDCAFANIHEQLKFAVRATAHIPDWLILPQALHWFHHLTGQSVDSCSPVSSVSHAKVPMLFIHGSEDHYVLPDNAKKLYDACSMPKELLMIPHAGHASSRYTDKQVYERHLFLFLDQYMKEQA